MNQRSKPSRIDSARYDASDDCKRSSVRGAGVYVAPKQSGSPKQFSSSRFGVARALPIPPHVHAAAVCGFMLLLDTVVSGVCYCTTVASGVESDERATWASGSGEVKLSRVTTRCASYSVNNLASAREEDE